MLLSKTCVNAIRATLDIATRTMSSDRKYVPVKLVAESINVSPHFLGKIAQILVDAKILISYRGPNGGVGLARPSSEIYLIEIIEATDGIESFQSCILGLPGCSEKNQCALHGAWKASRARLLSELRNRSVASVVGKQRARSRRSAKSGQRRVSST